MKPASNYSKYTRTSYLSTVPAEHRAIALQLCRLLEATFSRKDILLYSGFPIVMRDMEWTAGLSVRKSGPIAYCCSPGALKEMSRELKPFMVGKHCIGVKAKGGASVEDVLKLVAKAYRLASHHGGMICKADARAREKLRAKARST